MVCQKIDFDSKVVIQWAVPDLFEILLLNDLLKCLVGLFTKLGSGASEGDFVIYEQDRT